MWLVTCLEHRQFSLKSVGHHLGARNLSFCSPQRLMQFLGVVPGAVTPFAVINDVDSVVKVVLDVALLDINPLNFHPLDNSKTTAIAPDDFIRFLETSDHSPLFVNFEEDLLNHGNKRSES